MKISLFNSSPWGKEGHTYIMAQEFLFGAHQAGAKVQNIQLVEKEIKPCIGCWSCFYKTPGKCIFKDDMESLIHRFLGSDVVVFVTPLYMDNVTTLMKTFTDRLMPILEPHCRKDPNGQYRRGMRFEKCPRFVVISGCAMPEQGQFDVLRLFFRRFARTMHTEVIGEIYRTEAGFLYLSSIDKRFAQITKEYQQLLRTAGEEFVATGRISKQMTQRLGAPLIGADEYIEYANKVWDQILPKSTFRGIANVVMKQLQHRK